MHTNRVTFVLITKRATLLLYHSFVFIKKSILDSVFEADFDIRSELYLFGFMATTIRLH